MRLAIATIDLNADVGESFGRYSLGDDRALPQVVTARRVRVARGRSGSDSDDAGTGPGGGSVGGAHPSFPDLQGFGRREMQMAPDDLRDAVIYQVAAVAGLAAAEGVRLHHVKAHGALYNMACRSAGLADAVVAGVAAFDASLAIYALPDSALSRAAAAAGLPVAEGFLDRQYEADGSLTPRTVPGAVIHDPAEAARRAVAWMQTGKITTRTGEHLALPVSALCVHGDTSGAVALRDSSSCGARGGGRPDTLQSGMMPTPLPLREQVSWVPGSSALALVLALGACSAPPPSEPTARRPNIVLVMTDDQGWAQLGMRGDSDLRTPHIDRLASESVEFRRFYASPVCAPTRASLMTGRDAYRTGVTDTWLGRALMAPDEVTVAEALGNAGYRTGIFGKWHLGDSYPMRAQDQGFQEVLVHRGGGIGQPSDPPGSDYTNPILFDNGEQRQFDGYVTDVLFSEAMRFIDAREGQPFLAYIATNAPHAPYLVPDSYREPYAALGLSDRDARIYGMITNIDDNMGRLVAFLDDRGLRDDTILVFMTDNGPTTERFTAGLRARKGSTYEGGIRVPFFLRWPGAVSPRQVDTIAAHIDLMPTFLEAAGVALPLATTIDGRSLLSLLRGATDVEWPARTIHIQAHRGNAPQPLRNFAAITDRYKLVEGVGFTTPPASTARPELYDITADPGETRDLAATLPDEVARLRGGYEAWLADVSQTRGFDPLPIALGSAAEPRVTLTRQDWRSVGPDGWGEPHLGAWEVDVRTSGTYDVRVDLPPVSAFESPARVAGGRLHLRLGDSLVTRDVAPGSGHIEVDGVEWTAGRATLDAHVTTPDGRPHGVWFIHVARR